MSDNSCIANRIIQNIDQEIETWYQHVNKATKKAIPTTRHRPLPHSPHSQYVQTLIRRFNDIN